MRKGDTPPIWVEVKDGQLVPCSAYDEERIGSYKAGNRIRVTLWQGRNPKLLRKYWAVLRRCVEQAPTPWDNADEASDAIKLALGITQVGKTVTGKFFLRPGSISFTEMQENEFQDFYEKAMAVLAELTGLSIDEIESHAADTRPDLDDEPPEQPVEGDGDVQTEVAPEPEATQPEEAGGGGPPAAGIDERFIHAVRQFCAVPLQFKDKVEQAKRLKSISDWWKSNIVEGDYDKLENLYLSIAAVIKAGTPGKVNAVRTEYAKFLGVEYGDLEPTEDDIAAVKHVYDEAKE